MLLISGILAHEGKVQKLNYKLLFLRTYIPKYFPNTKKIEFIGIHMSGVKLPKRKAIWNELFGPNKQNNSKLNLSEKDLIPSEAQIEMENHIINENT